MDFSGTSGKKGSILKHVLKPLAFTLLTVLLLLAAVAGQNRPGTSAARSGADWPQFRGPDRNGISPQTGLISAWPADGPKRLWTAAVGTGYSSVAVSRGKAYTTGNVNGTDTVFCLNALTGAGVWKYSCPAAATAWDSQAKSYPGTRATPTVDGTRVYTFSLDAQLHCLDAESGKPIWKKDLLAEYKPRKTEYRWGFASSPVIVGRMLIQHLNAETLAFDKTTGKEIWHWQDGEKEKDSGGYSTPVLFDSGGTPAVAVLTKSLVALTLDKGQELWRVNRWQPYDHGLNAADPIFLGNGVFLSQGNYTRSCGVFRFGGSGRPATVWRNEADKGSMLVHFQSPVLKEGKLYGFSDGKLRCIDFATGQVHWTENVGTDKYGSLILADGKLIVMTDRGELILVAAQPDKCTILARAQVIGKPTWTAPSLAGGLLYCRNTKGDVVCLDVRKSR